MYMSAIYICMCFVSVLIILFDEQENVALLFFFCFFFRFFFLFFVFLSCVLKETCQETSRGAAIEGACFRAVFSGSPFSKTTGKNKHAASLTMLDLGGDRPTLDSKAVFAYRSSLGFRSRA